MTVGATESGTTPAEDEAAIRAIVADVEAGFNGNDAELMNRHVAADATVVNAVGQELRGRRPLVDPRPPEHPGPVGLRARGLGLDLLSVDLSPGMLAVARRGGRRRPGCGVQRGGPRQVGGRAAVRLRPGLPAASPMTRQPSVRRPR